MVIQTVEREMTPEEEFFSKLTQEQLLFMPFVEGITLIEGIKGTGKTASGVCIARGLRDFWGYPTVSTFKLNDAYGQHQSMSIDDFVDALKALSQSVNQKDIEGESRDILARAMQKTGFVNLDRVCIVLDEAYQYMDKRRSFDKIVQLFGYFIAQSRHFQSPIIIICPDGGDLDKRIIRQLDRVVKPRLVLDTPEPHVRCFVTDLHSTRKGGFIVPLNIYGQYYDSWKLLPMRGSSLNVKQDDYGSRKSRGG